MYVLKCLRNYCYCELSLILKVVFYNIKHTSCRLHTNFKVPSYSNRLQFHSKFETLSRSLGISLRNKTEDLNGALYIELRKEVVDPWITSIVKHDDNLTEDLLVFST